MENLEEIEALEKMCIRRTQKADKSSREIRRKRLLEHQERMESDAIFNGELIPSRNISFSTVGRGSKTGY